MPMRRWIATIRYRTAAGFTDVPHDLEEIEDLQPLVALGPHWDTIKSITIVRPSETTDPFLTVEEAVAR